MEASEARRLRKLYGNRLCPHTEIDKEYESGTQTDDYVCVVCGRFVDPDKKKLNKSKKVT